MKRIAEQISNYLKVVVGVVTAVSGDLDTAFAALSPLGDQAVVVTTSAATSLAGIAVAAWGVVDTTLTTIRDRFWPAGDA